MARHFHEVLAAHQCRIGIGQLNVRCTLIEIQEFPPAKNKSDIERERQIMVLRDVIADWQGFEIGKQIADIIGRHARIRSIGEGRIKMFAIAAGASGHGVTEFGKRPFTDANLGVR
ncbi:hypothetical protein D3C80_1853540 [compost metagenome]